MAPNGGWGCAEGDLELVPDIYQLALQASQQERYTCIVREGKKWQNECVHWQLGKTILDQRLREYTSVCHCLSKSANTSPNIEPIL